MFMIKDSMIVAFGASLWAEIVVAFMHCFCMNAGFR